ncbi:hypothetical protein ACVV2G_14560 [Streptomyces ziwulingensis]
MTNDRRLCGEALRAAVETRGQARTARTRAVPAGAGTRHAYLEYASPQ